MHQPAAGLKGRSQRLVMRYALCGMETDFGPLVVAIVGGVLVLPALVAGIVIAHSAVGSAPTGESMGDI